MNQFLIIIAHSQQINKMKSGDKLPRPVLRPSPLEDSFQFQEFKDEQFTNHRKSQIHCKRLKQKTIKSLSVYNIAKHPRNTLQPSQSHQQSRISPRNRTLGEMRQKQSAPLVIEQKTINEPRSRGKDATILRYSRVQSYKSGSFQLTQQQKDLLKSTEKIQLIKKILDLYNSKSIERAYYSNLINNLSFKGSPLDPATVSPTPTTSNKNKIVTIKKLPPKGSFRKTFRRTTNANNEILIRIGQLNMHGFDLAEQYYNNNSITLEAQGMNDLIRDFLEKKRMNQSAENSYSFAKKKSMKTKSNQELLSMKECVRPVRKNLANYQTLSEIKAKMLENMSDNSVDHKVNKFRQFLFMINFANGVYRELDIQKYDEPFKIFVGNGNNSNLIKSIIKKRFWFDVTKNREEAHFVWMQLKQETVYEKQLNQRQQIHKSKQSEDQIVNELCEDAKQVEQTSHTAREDMSENDKPTQSQKKQRQIRIMTKTRLSKIDFKSTQMKLLTVTQNMDYNSLLGQFVIRKKYRFSDRLKYMKNIEICPLSSMKSLLIHNHLPLNGLLGNKKAMFYMLRQYYRLTQRSIFDIVPLTYHVKKGFLDEEFKAFVQRFQQQSKNGKNYWIMKPGEFSNRGQGITCTEKFEDIRNRIANLRKMGRNKSLILQKYITNPLLYNNRKFDIRTYMLLTANNNHLRAYWYQDGYIRTSSSVWTLHNITDTMIHLTNDAIQKYSNNYGKYEPGNKLTYSELQRYLDNIKNSRACNFQIDIYPLLKQIATDTVKATSLFINPQRNGSNFQIFGFDFMIDANFKPWLIEINTNPCLQMSCPVLERIIPSMVQNAFRIAVDPIFPPPMNFSSTYKYNIPENALHYNKFQLIFDQERDGSALRQLYAGNNIVQTIDEYQQDKDIYEQEGEQLALLQP